MRNAKFKSIRPNYRKRVLEIELKERGRISRYLLPFAVFREHEISAENKFKELKIESELGHSAVLFQLEDGTSGDFPSDWVLYYCDPSYEWAPLNQLRKALKGHLKASKLSVRVLADALNTSPSQVIRILEAHQASKQLSQLCQLAQLAGYQIDLTLKRKSVA